MRNTIIAGCLVIALAIGLYGLGFYQGRRSQAGTLARLILERDESERDSLTARELGEQLGRQLAEVGAGIGSAQDHIAASAGAIGAGIERLGSFRSLADQSRAIAGTLREIATYLRKADQELEAAKARADLPVSPADDPGGSILTD